MRLQLPLALLLVACQSPAPSHPNDLPQGGTWEDLVELFHEWRTFEKPPMRAGAPDYTAARFEAALGELPRFEARLKALDPSAWSLEQQVDWHVVRAEMRGFEFHATILQPGFATRPSTRPCGATKATPRPTKARPTTPPWSCGPTASRSPSRRCSAWSASWALYRLSWNKRAANLTGDAGELFSAGIRNLQDQAQQLVQLGQTLGSDAPDSLQAAVVGAELATRSFVAWLEAEAPSRTGPSGIGKENYTRYLQDVHLVPLTWEDEVRLLQRELDRAWSNLKLEEHRNRNLPELVPAANAAEFDQRATAPRPSCSAFWKSRTS